MVVSPKIGGKRAPPKAGRHRCATQAGAGAQHRRRGLRPLRPPGYNVEAKRGSCQMDSISHQRLCNFSPSTLDSGGAGGGALTPRCAKTPEHTAPCPEVVRNTVHLPTRCARSSLSAVHFRHNPWNSPSRIGSFQNPWRSPSRRATGTLGVALREGLLEKPWSSP